MTTSADLDWHWATRTGGRLSGKQRRALLRSMTASVPQLAANAVRTRTGRRGQGRLEFASSHVPDSAIARAAEQEARETVSPHVLEHCYRTYFFGKALADLDQIKVDEELVYVASLLHDLQLEHPTPGRCFAVTGAEKAVHFLHGLGVSDDRAQEVGAAVAAHIDPAASRDLSDAGGFVSAGAGTDVFGLRIADLDPAWVNELLALHPRLGFTAHMLKAWADESAAVPDGRAAFLTRYAAFPTMIRMAPFAE